MSELTRRGFVRGSASAAAGVAAMTTLGVADADAKSRRAKHPDPVVAWLGNPRDGTVTIMSGDGQVTIRDHALAAKIAEHAKKARDNGRKKRTKHR